jgi:hypothetical protein
MPHPILSVINARKTAVHPRFRMFPPLPKYTKKDADPWGRRLLAKDVSRSRTYDASLARTRPVRGDDI